MQPATATALADWCSVRCRGLQPVCTGKCHVYLLFEEDLSGFVGREDLLKFRNIATFGADCTHPGLYHNLKDI